MKRPVALAVALAAFAVRASWLLAVGPDPSFAWTADSVNYVAGAGNLRNYQVFSQSAREPLAPDTVRTPGYPAFLVAFVGAPGPLDAMIRARDVEWAQAALGAATAGLIAAAALVLWESAAAAAAAGVLAAVDPMLLMHTPLLLTETLFLFLFSAGLLALALGLKKDSPLEAALAGLLFGLAALTRPVGLYYFVPAALVAAWALRRKRSRAAWLAVFVAASAALPLCWMARNESACGVFTFSSIQGLNFTVRAASVDAEVKKISMGEATADVEGMIKAEHPAPFASVAEESQFEGRWSGRFIMRHPLGYAAVMAKDVVKILGGHGMELFAWEILKDSRYDPLHTDAPSGRFAGTRALFERHRPLKVLIPVYWAWLVGVYSLAAFGFFSAWGKRETRWTALLCASVIVYFLGVTAGLGAYYSLRIPLLGAVYLLAGFGFAAISGSGKHPKRNS